MNSKACLLLFVLSLSFGLKAQNDSIKALVQSDLPIITYLTENDSTIYYNEDESLTRYFSIELIDHFLEHCYKKGETIMWRNSLYVYNFRFKNQTLDKASDWATIKLPIFLM